MRSSFIQSQTCICNCRQTTSSKSQPSRRDVTNTRASSLYTPRLPRNSPAIASQFECDRSLFRAEHPVVLRCRSAVMRWCSRCRSSACIDPSQASTSSSGATLSSARITSNCASMANCWIARAMLRGELSRSQARSVLMTLSEARVSLAWVSRDGVSISGRMVNCQNGSLNCSDP